MSLPGVPAVPSSVSLLEDVILIFADVVNFLTNFGASQWGIFQNGESVVTAETVVALGYKQDWSISTFNVEEGGFQSYNKVDTPYNARVRFASGGSQSDRQALLDSIDAIAGNTELYDIVTPEKVFTAANIQSFDYSRTAQNGVGLIQVDVKLIEVRVTATASFSNTQSPSSTGQVNDGSVQTKPYAGPNLGPLGKNE